MTTDFVECEHCQHYRPQTSFVDSYKRFDQSPPRVPIMKSLQEISKEEIKTLENEAEIQVNLVSQEEMNWPEMPRFAPVCVVSGGRFVPAVKNRDGLCPDFQLAVNRQGKGCRTCRFVARPETKIGDRRVELTADMDQSAVSHYRQVNKEQADADATAQAMEIEQAFYGNGRLSVVSFLPSCAVRITMDERHVVPFCNVRQDCPDHRPLFPVSPVIFEALVGSGHSESTDSLDATVALTRLVAESGSTRPGAFFKTLVKWVETEPRRASVMPWAVRCLATRWIPEASRAGGADTVDTRLDASALTGVHTAAQALEPFVAGCDAYEWGVLASLSQTNPGSAAACANAICQQLAEFLVTVVSPLDAARCIDSTVTLIRAPGLFAEAAVDRADGFLKLLSARAQELQLSLRTDLVGYYEEFLSHLSYSVGAWLRLLPKDATKFAMLGSQVTEAIRRRTAAKVDSARQEGAWILTVCAALASRRLSSEDCSSALARLNSANEAALQSDFEDQRQLQDAILGWTQKLTGAAQDPLTLALTGQAMSQRDQDRNQSVYALEIPRRKVMAELLFRRGTVPITPTALELLGRQPQLDRTPETPEEALREPTSKTLEAFHAGRLGSPNGVAGVILAGSRRTGSPQLINVQSPA